ncbi:hypothetical protein ACQCVK_05005 [Rossellomorea vietnamensis]|uniref:hypothetical protein n=1 Tax=Rossellomorea TaxID=2837508 RepID=UPI0037C9CDFC
MAFVWGTTFVVIQSAISSLPPFTLNTVRFPCWILSSRTFAFAYKRRLFSHKLLLSDIPGH